MQSIETNTAPTCDYDQSHKYLKLINDNKEDSETLFYLSCFIGELHLINRAKFLFGTYGRSATKILNFEFTGKNIENSMVTNPNSSDFQLAMVKYRHRILHPKNMPADIFFARLNIFNYFEKPTTIKSVVENYIPSNKSWYDVIGHAIEIFFPLGLMLIPGDANNRCSTIKLLNKTADSKISSKHVRFFDISDAYKSITFNMNNTQLTNIGSNSNINTQNLCALRVIYYIGSLLLKNNFSIDNYVEFITNFQPNYSKISELFNYLEVQRTDAIELIRQNP